mmetsp:Transcript_6162/g.17224  ORF Transcript_6162/g.17224 Transcript_6162/m.17224 type:complete len:266 (-) Transcript_6162:184-981(-)
MSKALKARENLTSDILHRERNAVKMFYGAAVACLFGVFAFFYNAPPLSGEACNDVSLLWVIRAREEEAMSRVVACTSNYREDHAGYLLAGYIMLYVTLQSFAIPGPLVLSVLAGALYPFTFGTILVASCCTSGASVCFLISGHLGVPLLKGLGLMKHLERFRHVVDDQRQEGKATLMVFLSRFSPVPNIVINLASPLVGVPLPAFVVGSFFGMMPMNFVHLMTGKALANADRISKWPALLILATGFVLVLIFVMYEKSRTRTHVT